MATATKRKTTLHPLHDRVLIRRIEEQDEKHGSNIIPDTAKDKPQEGKVIAVGTGKVTDEGKRLPLAVKEGDRILFGKYSGSEVKIDDRRCRVSHHEGRGYPGSPRVTLPTRGGASNSPDDPTEGGLTHAEAAHA